MMVSIYSMGKPVPGIFHFGAGIERVITCTPEAHDCYLCLSQQSDISQRMLTTGVLPPITSYAEGSLWRHRGWKVKANPSGTLIVSAEQIIEKKKGNRDCVVSGLIILTMTLKASL